MSNINITASQMFAKTNPAGDQRCYFCGGWCDKSRKAADHVLPSFTARDGVPGGRFVCAGCVQSMSDHVDIVMLDGERRTQQKVRCYSWLITEDGPRAATKAHLSQLRGLCLSPPQPPYAIVLSDKGQRHFIYMAALARDAAHVVANLDGVAIAYAPAQLQGRLELAKQIAAASGKPCLTEAMTATTAARVAEYYDDCNIVEHWLRVWNEPLSRLASWLCPAKEECQHEYRGRTEPAATNRKPEHRAAQTTFGWFD